MKRLAVAVIVPVVLATCALAFARTSAQLSWRSALDQVQTALDRGDHATAVAAWQDAYGAALAARSWQALLEVGDASLTIGDSNGGGRPAVAKARFLYRNAFFRARSESSVGGMVDAAERFEALGDREVAAQCLVAAHSVAKRDTTAIARIHAVASRLAGPTAAR